MTFLACYPLSSTSCKHVIRIKGHIVLYIKFYWACNFVTLEYAIILIYVLNTKI